MIQLPDFAQDKLGHFFYGTLLSFAVSFVLPPIYILIIVFSASVSKELWDKFKRKKQFSPMDIFFNMITSILLYATQTYF